MKAPELDKQFADILKTHNEINKDFATLFKEFLKILIQQNYNLPIPFIYPSTDGTLRAEWSIQMLEISIDVDYHKNELYLHISNMVTHSYIEYSTILSTDNEILSKIGYFLDKVLD